MTEFISYTEGATAEGQGDTFRYERFQAVNMPEVEVRARSVAEP